MKLLLFLTAILHKIESSPDCESFCEQFVEWKTIGGVAGWNGVKGWSGKLRKWAETQLREEFADSESATSMIHCIMQEYHDTATIVLGIIKQMREGPIEN
jgi:hypothetical protein